MWIVLITLLIFSVVYTFKTLNDDYKRYKEDIDDSKFKNVTRLSDLPWVSPVKTPAEKWDSYDQYLKSDTWKRKRVIALNRANNKCQLCKSGVNLQVHHNEYSKWGTEEPHQLIVLCGSCHQKHHNK